MHCDEALAAALDDEYHARAFYRAVLSAFGNVRPFCHIVESEERHIEALLRHFERHASAPPPDRWAGRCAAPASLAEACRKAAAAERANARLYAELLAAAADDPALATTFARLRDASQERHLPAFERCLERETRRGSNGRHGGCA